MSYSYTLSESQSFTITHARQLASKVAADLMRMNRLYGKPSIADIDEYEKEMVAFLHQGYLGTVTYGFKRDGKWIEPTVRYVATEISSQGLDDDPGRVRPGQNISGASFSSYLTYSAVWDALTTVEQEKFRATLPFKRVGAPEPGVANGYFASDKTYSSGGVSLGRSSIRSF